MQAIEIPVQPSISRIPRLPLLLLLCFGAEAAGGLLTARSVGGWYQGIQKPSFNPPDWIFGPVWTFLFFLMAISAWLVWRRVPLREAGWSPWFFMGQLILNVVWSGLFFGLRNPALAFAEILVLWVAIAGTILCFRRHSTAAALLLLPYLGWVSFATVLNFTIWSMNP